MRTKGYVPRVSDTRISEDQIDFIRRRTLPFIDTGMHLPLDRLMAEAYLQGMRDVLQTQDERP